MTRVLRCSALPIGATHEGERATVVADDFVGDGEPESGPATSGLGVKNGSITCSISRKKVSLGMIEIQRLASNTPEQDKALSFSPDRIPDGIETADPMLDFRAKAYPISLKGRQ